MTPDQRNRLLALAHEAAMLTAELQRDRATSTDKARIRGVLKHLEPVNLELTEAVERAEA